MIPNEEKEGWHYLAVKELPRLLRRTHEKVWKNKGFYGIALPSERDKILELKQYVKSHKIPYVIYAEIESLIKKNRWMWN